MRSPKARNGGESGTGGTDSKANPRCKESNMSANQIISCFPNNSEASAVQVGELEVAPFSVIDQFSMVNRMRTIPSSFMSVLFTRKRPIFRVLLTCSPAQGVASRSAILTMRMVVAFSGTFHRS